MRRIAEASAVVGVLALISALAGCGGGAGVPGASEDAAGKPAKPPPAPEHAKYTVTPMAGDADNLHVCNGLNNAGCAIGSWYGSPSSVWQAGAFYPAAAGDILYAIAEETGAKTLIAGTTHDGTGDLQAAVFEWESLTHSLGLVARLAGAPSGARAISPNGQLVAGFIVNAQGVADPCVWRHSSGGGWETVLLPPPPSPTPRGYVYDINDAGQVAGYRREANRDIRYWAFWQPTGQGYGYVHIDMMGDGYSFSMNQRGQFAGGHIAEDGGGVTAAVWEAGSHQHLPLPSGKQWVASRTWGGVNDATPVQVAGVLYGKGALEGEHAAIWEQSASGWQVYNLNDLLADGTPPCHLDDCYASNDVGQIVCTGTYEGVFATMLLTPVQ